ncbi:MAG: helix-turn-helix domain-containing protein [Alphaproteobacteria bacterium]|nr:helix-turn-helix domain-containing protein [Alphaproteobacteria bacterium]
MSKLKQNLEKLMRQKGLSQKGLAVKAGLNETAVRDILRGRSKDPQLSTLRALANVLQCNVEDFYRDLPLPGAGEKPGVRDSIWPPDICAAAETLLPSAASEMVVIDEVDIDNAHGIEALRAGRKHVVLRRWCLPPDFLRQRSTADFSKLKIVSVEGDAMTPEFQPGDRVMVDTSDVLPTPPGVFIVWDGMGLSLRRCEVRPGSSPSRLVLSAGNPDYESHEVPFRESVIGGRVIAKWQWL